MQHGALPCGIGDSDLKIPSDRAIKPDGAQIVIENHEQAWFPHLQFELLPELSAQGRNVVLASIDAAAKETPMPRIPDVRNIIPKLHDIASIFQDEQRGNSVPDLQRGAGCEEIHWKQCKSVFGAEWNCSKVGVKSLVIASAAVITPRGNG